MAGLEHAREAGSDRDRARYRCPRSAIGMAEMLAHEIKNPLAGIRGAAQLIGMNLRPEDQDLAELIVAESRRIVNCWIRSNALAIPRRPAGGGQYP
jgi:nitrogen-specific signal transduction histidine kinase